MTRRSLWASEQGIRKASRAFERTELTQKELADELDLKTTYSIIKFFKSRRVDRKIFKAICDRLDLDWEEIAAEEKTPGAPAPGAPAPGERVLDIDALVQEVREAADPIIQDRCSTMRVLYMSQPISISKIYTKVNILEKIPRNRYLEIPDLRSSCNGQDFDRWGLARVYEPRVSGLEAVSLYDKLMVLGKPGSGKTTFLKHLAIHCTDGKFKANLVPIFVSLKDFAAAPEFPSLLAYITCIYAFGGFFDLQMDLPTQLEKQLEQKLKTAISQGRAMILLDGLDEVAAADHQKVVSEIHNFSRRFHRNRFVITCRIAARKYLFEKFTEVEVAEFDSNQIYIFTNKWFEAKQPVAEPKIAGEELTAKAQLFLKKLEANRPIKELASNPLLLTMLCLVFEERARFPSNRAELYQEGADILLEKWDAQRQIERDEIYKELSSQRKQDLLGRIALAAFEEGVYFFKKQELERQIADYIDSLLGNQADAEVLQLDSEAVLQSIERQHGLLVQRARNIYSFSHLTFQEYFTAREIIGAADREQALSKLVDRIYLSRWREVFLLSCGIAPNADELLQRMKQKIDTAIDTDVKIHKFLAWVEDKSLSVQTPYHPAAVRAFYFALIPKLNHSRSNLDVNLDLALAIDPTFNYENDPFLSLDYLLVLVLARALVPVSASSRSLTISLRYARACARVMVLSGQVRPELEQALDELNEQLPGEKYNGSLPVRLFHSQGKIKSSIADWWQANGEIWRDRLRAAIVKYRNIGRDWQFSREQRQLLQQYYDAHCLLINCLHSAGSVSPKLREKIENTLLRFSPGHHNQ